LLVNVDCVVKFEGQRRTSKLGLWLKSERKVRQVVKVI